MDNYLAAAIEEAKKGMAAGGIPIGAVLVIDGRIVGRGHNQRVQKGSAVLLYGIPKVVVGENHTFRGSEEYLRSRGAIQIAMMPSWGSAFPGAYRSAIPHSTFLSRDP
jgi:cytosine deaminase